MAAKKKAKKAKKVVKKVPTTNERIAALNEELELLVGDWEEDGCMPANYVRQNGSGSVHAIVDRWCGHYQEPHNPIMIGWRVSHDNQVWHDCLLVSDYDSLDDAIQAAQDLADEAFNEAMQKLDPNWVVPEKPKERCKTCGRELEADFNPRSVELWACKEDGTWECCIFADVPRALGEDEDRVVDWITNNPNGKGAFNELPSNTQFFGVYNWDADYVEDCRNDE
jgi:hypothetical protein